MGNDPMQPEAPHDDGATHDDLPDDVRKNLEEPAPPPDPIPDPGPL